MRTSIPLTPSNRFEAAYESVLTEDARTELLRPRRARIPIRPPLPPQKRSWVDLARSWWHPAFAWLLALVAIVAVVAVSWPSSAKRAAALQESASRSRETQAAVTKALEALRAPIPEPIPMPTPYTSWESYIAAHRAPRAELVPIKAKRATLLRLPWQELGVYKWYELPDAWNGGAVWARYMGTVGRFSQIPPNPAPGDLWNVTETGASWIYCFPQGYTHPIWIDP